MGVDLGYLASGTALDIVSYKGFHSRPPVVRQN